MASSDRYGRGTAEVPLRFPHQAGHRFHVAPRRRDTRPSGLRTGVHLYPQTGCLQSLIDAVGDERSQRSKFFWSLLPVVEYPDFLAESVWPKFPRAHQKMGMKIPLVATGVGGMQGDQHHAAVLLDDIAGNAVGEISARGFGQLMGQRDDENLGRPVRCRAPRRV